MLNIVAPGSTQKHLEFIKYKAVPNTKKQTLTALFIIIVMLAIIILMLIQFHYLNK